jgi:high-affinity iron transporter
VAVVAFIAHHKLPYRKILEFTGILLGVALLVMVGEQAREMQLGRLHSDHDHSPAAILFPDWLGLWFSVFPTVETLAAQAAAAVA